ncbi:hypothetical protein IAT38_004279 [Cryptococcus sp. DSM 104549]
MPPRQGHDAPPPPHWPESITFLTKPRLSPTFPSSLIPLVSTTSTFTPHPVKHPTTVHIKKIAEESHPANGQFGLFAKQKIKENELVIPYLGVVHATLAPEDGSAPTPDEHSESDYDLSLLRLSSSDPRNPFPGSHISIGVDAARSGNAGRFVNDFRGVKPSGPNAEFRVGRGEGGEMRMEIWSLKGGVGKGDEVVVSYGKGWWGARTG